MCLEESNSHEYGNDKQNSLTKATHGLKIKLNLIYDLLRCIINLLYLVALVAAQTLCELGL